MVSKQELITYGGVGVLGLGALMLLSKKSPSQIAAYPRAWLGGGGGSASGGAGHDADPSTQPPDPPPVAPPNPRPGPHVTPCGGDTPCLEDKPPPVGFIGPPDGEPEYGKGGETSGYDSAGTINAGFDRKAYRQAATDYLQGEARRGTV